MDQQVAQVVDYSPETDLLFITMIRLELQQVLAEL
jgi:hypothetical protein